MNKRLLLIAIFSLIAAPALAGCATNDDTTDPTGTTEPTGTTQPTGEPTSFGVKTECDGMEESRATTTTLASLPTAPRMTTVTPANVAQGDALVLGTLLPLTGDLEAFGGSMENAATLAIEQINAAGGVAGSPVMLVKGDSRSDPTQAPNSFNSLLNDGVVGVAGAAASSVTGAILDIAIQSEVVVVSPASTSPTLTLERDNQGYFYRVPPSDALQGKVLAQLVYDAGCHSVSLLEINNAYGVGLGTVFAETYKGLGGTIMAEVKFEEGGTTFTSQVQQAGSGSPDAIVFVGYPNTGTQIVKEAYEKGILEDSVLYFSEGVKDPEFVQNVGKNADGAYILAGLSGTTPAASESPELAAFKAAYNARFGADPGLFAAETYDAIMALSLAAAHAGDATSGAAIKGSMLSVYNGPGLATSGATIAAGLAAAANGDDVDYVGASGNFDWDTNGDPADGIYSKWTVMDDGTISESDL